MPTVAQLSQEFSQTEIVAPIGLNFLLTGNAFTCSILNRWSHLNAMRYPASNLLIINILSLT